MLTQKTYVILLQPNYSGKGHNAIFKARYDEPLGAAIDFSLEMERKLLKAMGMYKKDGLLVITKGGFFSESVICFSNLPISKIKIFQKTSLSLKFEFVVYCYWQEI